MTWPVNFGNLFGGNQPLSLLDQQFQQTAQMLEIPCAASGATAISLTPLVNCPVLTGYTEFCAARFRAAANSVAGVTAQVNGLGFLPVYKADGVSQIGLNDIASGFEYVVRFSQALGGGVGGWFLEAPAVGSGSGGGSGIATPGGRLTLVAGVPVMATSTSGAQQIYYAPYISQFVPIWNGATLQSYNFCAGLSDQTGLTLTLGASPTWPAGNMFDVFVTLNAGVPVLAGTLWTNPGPSPPPTRSVGLSIFGGFLTNASTISMRINPSTTISVPANQATFLGSFFAINDGKATFRFGAAASGGASAHFGLCNYYNKVMVNTFVIDNGAPYTYLAATTRTARASPENQLVYVQSDSERAVSVFYNNSVKGVSVAGAAMNTGIGVTNAAFNVFGTFQQQAAAGVVSGRFSVYQLASVGLTNVFALEAGDGANANTFCFTSANILGGTIWL